MNKLNVPPLALNDRAAAVANELATDAAILGVVESRGSNGCRIIDAGVSCAGSFAAGVLVARACMSDLGTATLRSSSRLDQWKFDVEVSIKQPTIACLASQYAGWALSGPLDQNPDKTYHAMASGPGRALCLKEPLFEELGYKDNSECAVLILEADALPPVSICEKVSHDCAVSPQNTTLIVTPTGSMAGVVQISARVVEVALHKAHALGFPLDTIREGLGATPLPPPTSDSAIAMGRTNDTILFGGCVHLFVETDDDAAQELAAKMPSNTSRDYGKPFATVFKEYNYDFFKVDPLLFSPAQVWVTNVTSGKTFTGGQLNEALLMRSFA